MIPVYKRNYWNERGKGDGGIGGFVEKLLVNGVTLTLEKKGKKGRKGEG